MERLLCPSFQREMLEDAHLCSHPGTKALSVRRETAGGSAPWEIILLIYVMVREKFCVLDVSEFMN